MSHHITVMPSERHFTAESDQSILDAALDAGVILPYGCRNGRCGSCKGKVLSGDYHLDDQFKPVLSPAELAEGMTLFCRATACSDLTIQTRDLTSLGGFLVQKLPARVASLESLAPDVIKMTVLLPAAKKFDYYPGQYVEFILRDGQRRSYSIANASAENHSLEFHIRHMPGGKFTDQLFGCGDTPIKEKDILRLEGPMGTFFLREDTDKPIVFLASGTGFAPIKGILEYMETAQLDREAVLYWGARRPIDLYMHDWLIDFCQRHSWLRYIPVVSDALPEDNWSGRSEWVHQAVLNDISDLSNHEVYACGAPVMVDSARRDFIQEAFLPLDAFFADAFTSSADQ